MKSGKEIIALWEKEFKIADLPCVMRQFLIEAIEAGLMEAYREGQNSEEHRLRETRH